MKVVVQRVKQASVSVDNEIISKIDNGLMLLVSFNINDKEEVLEYMVNKILKLRIFDDVNNIMNKNILDVGGSVLSVSQFTLYGDTKKSNRPSYTKCMGGDNASILYDKFNYLLNMSVPVKTGRFKTHMEVSLINDGPVTIILEKEL